MDVARRPEFETNVRVGERVRLWNSHTFGDYYAYNAVRASCLCGILRCCGILLFAASVLEILYLTLVVDD